MTSVGEKKRSIITTASTNDSLPLLRHTFFILYLWTILSQCTADSRHGVEEGEERAQHSGRGRAAR